MIPRVYGKVGQPIILQGNAYDFGHTISAIEFSLDEGKSWTAYETPKANDYQLLTWNFTWQPEREGVWHMLIRSVNDEKKASPNCAHVDLLIS